MEYKSRHPILEKHGTVRWPLTSVSSIPVRRSFAAYMLQLCRRHNGLVTSRKWWAHYRAANGRPVRWPVRGAVDA